MIAATSTEHKTVVKYDRSTSAWLSINGTTQRHDSKQAALWYALDADHPALARAARDMLAIADGDSDVEKRLLDAAGLVAKSKVEKFGADNWRVLSQGSRYNGYNVVWQGVPKLPTCECEDHQRGNAPSTAYGPATCKHILAVLLLQFSQPIPFEGEPCGYADEYGLEAVR